MSNGLPIEPQQAPDGQGFIEPQEVPATGGGRSEVDTLFFAPDNVQEYTKPQPLTDPLQLHDAYRAGGTSAPFDVEQFAEVVANANVPLTLADLLLLEMVKFQRRSVHHKYGAQIPVPVTQTAAGYFKIAQPPSGNQYLKVVMILLAFTTGAGTAQFLHGTAGANTDAALSGAMTLALGTPLFMHAPNPDGNPLFATSPGSILGLNTATNPANGMIVYQVSADDK